MDWLIELIQRDPDTAVRIIAVIIGLVGMRGIYLMIQRGNRDAEIIGRTLEREQERSEAAERLVEKERARTAKERERANELKLDVTELAEDITERTKERWTLIAERIQVEDRLKECQERLEKGGISGLTADEEKELREMIVRKQEDILERDRRITYLTSLLKSKGQLDEDP